MSAPPDLRATMSARSTEELRRIASVDAADYTAEAIAMAREELAKRGEDVSTLVPASTSRTAAADATRSGASLFIAALGLALVTAPFIGDAPGWAQIAVGSAISALAIVGAKSALAAKR